MDYRAVYARFIASRRVREAQLPKGSYTERHHIMPRLFGGGHGKENLIRLTPDDHFFAHLLLGKIYGGKMWSALLIMANKPRASRVSLATLARMRRYYARARQGVQRENNVNFNPQLFEWVNLDTGVERRACIFDMHIEFGAGRPSWTQVAAGDRKTIKGWAIKGSDIRIRGLKGKRLSFVNRDGRAFEGTQGDFCRMTGLSVAAACRISRGQSVTYCGWRLDGTPDRRAGAPRNGQRSGKPATVFTLERDGVRVTGDRVQLAKHFGTSAATVSATLYSLRRGTLKTGFKGYRLAA